MTPEERARIGRAWLTMGLGEHASVAAFARFILHLLSLGAPPELVLEATRAMRDEVEHARLCFGIARRFNGEAAGPGRMDLSRVLTGRDDPASILTAAIVEGCFEETVSARCAKEALERLRDDAIRPALTRIVKDESRHADLSWRFVTWMLESYPELVPVAEECFARELAAPSNVVDEEECAALETHGHLLPASTREVREKTIQTEIRARSEALLGRAAVPAT